MSPFAPRKEDLSRSERRPSGTLFSASSQKLGSRDRLERRSALWAVVTAPGSSLGPRSRRLSLAFRSCSRNDRRNLSVGPPQRSATRRASSAPTRSRPPSGVLRTIEKETQIASRIETVDSLKGELIDDVASRSARLSGIQGIYVLISRKESKIEVLVSRRFSNVLSKARIEAIRLAFIEAFRRQEFNEGLSRGINAIQEVIGAAARTGELPRVPMTRAPVELEHSPAPRIAASTDNPPLILRNQARLTLAGARATIAAAEAKAHSMNLKVNIAVVDDGGHLLAFERMDGARPASGYTAITKATTAATFRQPTGPLPAGSADPDVLLNLSLQNAAQASGGKITTLRGGIPLEVDGQVIGGVGVGGGSGDQDAEIARRGPRPCATGSGRRPFT